MIKISIAFKVAGYYKFWRTEDVTLAIRKFDKNGNYALTVTVHNFCQSHFPLLADNEALGNSKYFYFFLCALKREENHFKATSVPAVSTCRKQPTKIGVITASTQHWQGLRHARCSAVGKWAQTLTPNPCRPQRSAVLLVKFLINWRTIQVKNCCLQSITREHRSVSMREWFPFNLCFLIEQCPISVRKN